MDSEWLFLLKCGGFTLDMKTISSSSFAKQAGFFYSFQFHKVLTFDTISGRELSFAPVNYERMKSFWPIVESLYNAFW